MLRIHGNKFKLLAGLSYAGLAGSSAAFLLILGAMLFAPAAAQPEASATENNSTISTYATTPTVGISLPTSINFADVLPTPSGATTTATADLTITTTDSAGYSLYLYSSDGDNSLRPNNSANISTINATAGDVGLTLSSLKPNTWGYNLGTEAPTDSTTYSAVPTDNSTPIQTKDTSDTNSANDTYTISLGAKVDNTIASGTYTNTLTVAVVAEPRALPYIQDFTLADCQSQAADADLTLRDKRDNNEYSVRYINGACWMTQNLRLAGGQTLTPAESNLIQNWTFPDRSLDGNDANYVGSLNNSVAAWASNTTYGGYYNYCGASAGTVCADSEENALQDICPKNWRLPNDEEMNSVAGTSYLDIFPDSQRYSSGTFGGFGGWWGSTVNALYYGEVLDPNGGAYNEISVGDSLFARKYGHGYSIRCIRSNPGALTVNFNGNGSTGGSTASQQIAAGNTASLNTNGFTRTGYAFTGWNTAADGSGTSYADGADYSVTPAIGNTTITLYAQWEELVNLLDDVTYMQDLTATQCSDSTNGTTATLIDRRDNNSYTIAKINGACWMTQNLRLAGGTRLNGTTSNISSSYTLPADSTASGTFQDNDGSVHYSGNTDYGSYYDFCAASAGTRCGYDSPDSGDDSKYDICPKGWRLPTDTEQSSITGTGYVSAFSPVYSGYYDGYYKDAALYGAGSNGYWWSATAYTSDLQWYLYYNHGSLSLGGAYNKRYGFSVRCVRSS